MKHSVNLKTFAFVLIATLLFPTLLSAEESPEIPTAQADITDVAAAPDESPFPIAHETPPNDPDPNRITEAIRSIADKLSSLNLAINEYKIKSLSLESEAMSAGKDAEEELKNLKGEYDEKIQKLFSDYVATAFGFNSTLFRNSKKNGNLTDVQMKHLSNTDRFEFTAKDIAFGKEYQIMLPYQDITGHKSANEPDEHMLKTLDPDPPYKLYAAAVENWNTYREESALLHNFLDTGNYDFAMEYEMNYDEKEAKITIVGAKSVLTYGDRESLKKHNFKEGEALTFDIFEFCGLPRPRCVSPDEILEAFPSISTDGLRFKPGEKIKQISTGKKIIYADEEDRKSRFAIGGEVHISSVESFFDSVSFCGAIGSIIKGTAFLSANVGGWSKTNGSEAKVRLSLGAQALYKAHSINLKTGIWAGLHGGIYFDDGFNTYDVSARGVLAMGNAKIGIDAGIRFTNVSDESPAFYMALGLSYIYGF